MNKEVITKSLLRLHCIGCTGHYFDCKGCTKEDEIKTILDTVEEKQKRTTKK